MGLRKIERYQRGHPKPEVEDGQTIQWPKEIGQKDKQGKLILSNTIYTERSGCTMCSGSASCFSYTCGTCTSFMVPNTH